MTGVYLLFSLGGNWGLFVMRGLTVGPGFVELEDCRVQPTLDRTYRYVQNLGRLAVFQTLIVNQFDGTTQLVRKFFDRVTNPITPLRRVELKFRIRLLADQQ